MRQITVKIAWVVAISMLSWICTPSLHAAEVSDQYGAGEQKPATELQKLAADGIVLLDKGAYEHASEKFNKALQLDPSQSWLQFLNGLAYHRRAVAGDSSLYDLAEQGYSLALKFDGSNWPARYYLGLLALDQRKFPDAQKNIGEALLANADNPEIVYSMLYASYYSGDPGTAQAMLERLKQLNPDDPRILRVSPLIAASLNNPDLAKADLDKYAATAKNSGEVRYLASRIADWKRFYNSLRPELPDATGGMREARPAAPAAALPANDRTSPVQESASLEDEMVAVDVVMISTEESVSTRKGVNLLNGLSLQYGWNYRYDKSTEDTNDSDGGVGNVLSTFTTATNLTHAISIPSVTYSLNIFNSNSDRNEILARPTLVAVNGQQSEFFSGRHIEAATVSSGTVGGESVKISTDIGVRLIIKPQLISKNKLRLNVMAERTFLQSPSPNIVYTSKVETTKTNVQANVVMEFGETLILSGLSEKETQNIRDGVPLLQNIPLLQYLFSRKDTRDFHKSVLILLTPRPRLNVYASTAAERLAGNTDILNELHARYSDWFKPYPNWASVFHHLQSNSLYREFRTGDVTMERWDTQQTFKDALRQATQFLYY